VPSCTVGTNKHSHPTPNYGAAAVNRYTSKGIHMFRAVFLILLFGMAGCASTQNQKITAQRIGVLVPESHNNQFCYVYKGVTAFNNESVKEQLTPNFSEQYGLYANRGIIKSGNIPVSLGNLAVKDISSYFVRKDWDHSISLTEKGKVFFRQLTSSNQIDLILLPWLYDAERCMVGAVLGYTDLEYELNSNIQLHLIDAKSFSHLQSRQVNSINSTRPVSIPSDKPKPSEEDRRKLAEKLYVELEDDVYRLLEGDCCYSKRTDLP
jgi:hypothetical protein